MTTSALLPTGTPFRVAMLVFPGITQLDLTGPHEVFTRVRGVTVNLVWKHREPLRSAGGLLLQADATFDDCRSADLLCIPGGPGHVELLNDAQTLDWIRAVASTAAWVTSVCTGSIVLGAAGLLRGYRATTHWGSLDALPLLGATAVEERVVFDRNRVTGAGVTSGMDFALAMVSRLWGEPVAQVAQLSLEYDPQPPLAAGSPHTAPPEIVARLRSLMSSYRDRVMSAAAEAAKRFPEIPR